MSKPKYLDLELMFKWQDQYLQDSLMWAKSLIPETTEREREIYKTGLEQGFHKAMALMRLHGYVTHSKEKSNA